MKSCQTIFSKFSNSLGYVKKIDALVCLQSEVFASNIMEQFFSENEYCTRDLQFFNESQSMTHVLHKLSFSVLNPRCFFSRQKNKHAFILL